MLRVKGKKSQPSVPRRSVCWCSKFMQLSLAARYNVVVCHAFMSRSVNSGVVASATADDSFVFSGFCPAEASAPFSPSLLRKETGTLVV